MILEAEKRCRKNCLFVNGSKIIISVFFCVMLFVLCSCDKPLKTCPLAAVHPAEKKADSSVDPVMGDWQGICKSKGTESPLVAQVIALGGEKYQVNLHTAFNECVKPIVVLDGQLEGTKANFSGQADDGTKWKAVIEGDKFSGSFKGVKKGSFKLEKVVRLSLTLGAKPPANAEILFDGSNLNKWVHPSVSVNPSIINLGKIIGGERCAAYLCEEIWSKKEQKAILEMGSDDGIKVWLNDQVVFADNAVMQACKPGQYKVEVTLKEGWNKLMLKVTQGIGEWAACVRLTGQDGKKLNDVRERLMGTQEAGTSSYLNDNDGYLTLWSVSGPYRQEGKKENDIFDIAFGPEIPNASDVKWAAASRAGFERKPARWKLVDGAMEVKPGSGSIITKKTYTNLKLHLEFRTPFMPYARGQRRGNSGVYLQGRYEVQILDSYGLEGRDDECGGIYKVSAPRVNMCAPPMQWQTYDITFYAPCFDSTGAKTKNARLTVLHNGVEIQNNLEIPGPTGASLNDNITEPGGIYLQDHNGDLVQYRNIWLVELP